MSTDNPPAATREALARAIGDPGAFVKRRQVTVGYDVHYEPLSTWQVRAILSSGILRDADEVRREAAKDARGGVDMSDCICDPPPYGDGPQPDCPFHGDPEVYRVGMVRGRAELRAAVEALCERAETVFDDTVIGIGQVRALIADDGVAALREHDRRVLEAAERRMFGTTDGDLIGNDSEIPAGELRRLLREPFDTAGEAGDE